MIGCCSGLLVRLSSVIVVGFISKGVNIGGLVKTNTVTTGNGTSRE